MQTLTEIRALLEDSGLAPQRQFGQNFLIDQNLMNKLLDLAQVQAGPSVLEIGPGTGSLTEELLGRASRVVAAEIDRGLCDLLAARLGGRPNFRLVRGDALAGKRHLSPAVLAELGPQAQLVSNLPYNVATPLVAQCLLDSWTATRRASPAEGSLTVFRSLTFTVQKEVADRLMALPGDESYGQVSVIVALLSAVQAGPILPPQAFWPRPAVDSRMMRLDFRPDQASRLCDADLLNRLLGMAFGQRRKQLGSIFRRKDSPMPTDALTVAAEKAGIDLSKRAEEIPPSQFLDMSNCLAESSK
jgi:16S rRNA (adenine1518-N6/adenine1519-N6)-dimethyltransferase